MTVCSVRIAKGLTLTRAEAHAFSDGVLEHVDMTGKVHDIANGRIDHVGTKVDADDVNSSHGSLSNFLSPWHPLNFRCHSLM